MILLQNDEVLFYFETIEPHNREIAVRYYNDIIRLFGKY